MYTCVRSHRYKVQLVVWVPCFIVHGLETWVICRQK